MRRDRACLLDILDAANLAVSYLASIDREEFEHNTQLQDSVIRRLEIIGEAARRVSPETQNDHPELPWMEMIGMRNILIHEYDDIDLCMVWETVRNELPKLIPRLEHILAEAT